MYSKRVFIICSLTCKSWSEPAIQTLYEEVKLNGTQIFKLKRSLSQDPGQHPLIQHGQFVQNLVIFNDKGCRDDESDIAKGQDSYNIQGYQDRHWRSNGSRFSQEEFYQLLSNLRNLKKLDISRNRFS